MSIRIALAGNPNCGKTTLFNALTGANQYVGNWPGVTVEKKEGKLKGDRDIIIQDLPGIYSLSPYTLEEVVARDYLVKEQPDVIDVYKRQEIYRCERSDCEGNGTGRRKMGGSRLLCFRDGVCRAGQREWRARRSCVYRLLRKGQDEGPGVSF